MPEPLHAVAVVPITGGTGYNVRTIKVTNWVLDPTTGVGSWVESAMQVLVMADKHGDVIDTDEEMSDVVVELRAIRELLEELILRI